MGISNLLRNYLKFVVVAILIITVLWILFDSNSEIQTETRVLQTDINSLISRLSNANADSKTNNKLNFDASKAKLNDENMDTDKLSEENKRLLPNNHQEDDGRLKGERIGADNGVNQRLNLIDTDDEETNTDGQESNTDEDENNTDGDESITDDQVSNIDDQVSNTDGHESNTDGQESNTDDEDTNTDDEDTNTDDEESSNDGQESNTDDEESITDDEENNTDGQESNTDGQESNTDGQESNTNGQESNTDGQESNTDTSNDFVTVQSFRENGEKYYRQISKPLKFERYAAVEDVPQVNVKSTNCSAIIEGDEDEISQAKLIQAKFKQDFNATEKLYQLSKDCVNFKKVRKYILYPVNPEEEEFPIAFSIVMYKDAFQVERLLRAIYRPQNLYCVHVDVKSSLRIKETMHNIANCFDNIFISSQVFDVKWGWFSVVKPELACMEDLLNHTRPWHYFVNTCGQEFPVKTNYELVRILKAFNGSNDVQGRRSDIVPQILLRIKQGFKYESAKAPRYPKPAFPYNITWAKGAVHVAITRGFVDFMINTKVGQDFVKYINDTPHASEHLFNPLHLSPNLGAPGSYTGFPNIKHDPVQGISVIRYKIWMDTHRRYKEFQCHGIFARQICVISLGDLHQVVGSGKLFVNKFHADYHPLAYDCLEEHIFRNTIFDIKGLNRLNITYYEKLDFVKNHI